MRAWKVALIGLAAVAACSTETPVSPASSPPPPHRDGAPADTTTTGQAGAVPGSGLFGSGH